MSGSSYAIDVGMSATPDVNEDFFDKILSCPIKRKLILNIISSEKDNLNKYKRNLVQKTPLKNVKKVLCESPTMLYRKRLLEQNGKVNSEVFSDNSNSRSSSRQSEVFSVRSNESSSGLFDKLLNGVVAYVEVKSSNEDRSSGVKMLMKSMGATIRDNFTRDVTHVIFKDGSFMTYQKAKLLNVPLLSVLWIEAIRSSGKRVPEKKFPALGLDGYNHNVSEICSQMEKEYQTIIKDELRKSMTTGTPLPSKRDLIDRRRTIMTPNLSNYSQSMGFHSSQDYEVARIMKQGRKLHNFTESVTPELTSDSDSDLGAIVDGDIVSRNTKETLQANYGDSSSMDLTNIEKSNFKENIAPNTLNASIYDKETPKLKSTKCKNFKNSLSNNVDDFFYNRRTLLVSGNDNLDECPELIGGSSSNNLVILSKNECVASPNINSQIEDTTTSFVPALKLSSERSNPKVDNSSSTNMSSLRISAGVNTISNASANILPQNSTKSTVDVTESDACKNMVDDICGKLDKSSNMENNIESGLNKKNAEKTSSTNISSLRMTSESINSNEVDIDDLKHKKREIVHYVNTSKTLNKSRCRKKNEDIEISPKKRIRIKAGTPKYKLGESKPKLKSVTKPIVSTSENSLSEHTGKSKEFYNSITTRRKSYAVLDNLHSEDIEETKVVPVTEQISKRQTEKSTKRKTIHMSVDRTPIKILNKLFSSETKSKHIDAIDPTSHMLPNSSGDSLKDTISKNLMGESLKFDEYVTTRKKVYRNLESSSNTKENKQGHNAEVTSLDEVSGKSREHEILQHNINTEKLNRYKNISCDITDESLPRLRLTRRKTMHNVEESKSKSVKSSLLPQSNKSIDKKHNKRRTFSVLEEGTPNKIHTITPTNSTSDSSDSGKKRRRRKLYNPNDSLKVDTDGDEIERQNLRQKVKEQKCDDRIFIQPNIISVKSNIIISDNAKNYIKSNNLNINEILNREADKPGSHTKKTRRNKETGKKNNVNTNDDEQRELLKEVLKNNNVQDKKSNKNSSKQKSVKINKRKSLRLTQMVNKKLNFSCSSEDEIHNEPVTPVQNRRSTMEFQTSVHMSGNRKLKIDRLQRPSIVCTKLHKDQIQVFNQIVKKLGGFDVENEITDKSTHLVAGEPKRTINMLRAVARGCWVLKHEWVLKSLEADKWLPEEDFEQTDFSPAIQYNRLQRQAFGPSFSMDIFQDCGLIYIARGSIPRCSDLRELVEICKGRITLISRNAEIVIGGFMKKDGVICLLETWILDSIMNNKKMSYKKYIISSDNKVIL